GHAQVRGRLESPEFRDLPRVNLRHLDANRRAGDGHLRHVEGEFELAVLIRRRRDAVAAERRAELVAARVFPPGPGELVRCEAAAPQHELSTGLEALRREVRCYAARRVNDQPGLVVAARLSQCRDFTVFPARDGKLGAGLHNLLFALESRFPRPDDARQNTEGARELSQELVRVDLRDAPAQHVGKHRGDHDHLRERERVAVRRAPGVVNIPQPVDNDIYAEEDLHPLPEPHQAAKHGPDKQADEHQRNRKDEKSSTALARISLPQPGYDEREYGGNNWIAIHDYSPKPAETRTASSP